MTALLRTLTLGALIALAAMIPTHHVAMAADQTGDTLTPCEHQAFEVVHNPSPFEQVMALPEVKVVVERVKALVNIVIPPLNDYKFQPRP